MTICGSVVCPKPSQSIPITPITPLFGYPLGGGICYVYPFIPVPVSVCMGSLRSLRDHPPDPCPGIAKSLVNHRNPNQSQSQSHQNLRKSHQSHRSHHFWDIPWAGEGNVVTHFDGNIFTHLLWESHASCWRLFIFF